MPGAERTRKDVGGLFPGLHPRSPVLSVSICGNLWTRFLSYPCPSVESVVAAFASFRVVRVFRGVLSLVSAGGRNQKTIGIRTVKFGGHCRCTIGGEGADAAGGQAPSPRPFCPRLRSGQAPREREGGSGLAKHKCGIFPHRATRRGAPWRIVIQCGSSDPD